MRIFFNKGFWILQYWFFPKQAQVVFMCLKYKSFEKTVGKGEIARNEQFPLFPVFPPCLESFLPFLTNLKILSANSFSFEVKILSFEKELTH